MKKTIILLMLGMTRAGKTTKVAALSSNPSLISRVCIKSNATTPVTTDWEVALGVDSVSLKKIELNPKVVYGNIYSRTVDKYNENLDNNPYLTDVLGLKKIEDAGILDPKDYVEAHLSEFINHASFDTIEKMMHDKRTGDCVRRLSILVPASEAFSKTLCEVGLDSVILRDTRGIMDLQPEEVEKMPNLSMYDLGLDGVDAVLLMCSSSVFPVQAGEWYKKIYGECFRAVPIFLEARHDALLSIYQIYSDMNDISIEDYLKQVNGGKIKAFSDKKDTHFVHGLELLSVYGAAFKNYAGSWNFNYSVFDMDRCLYLTPTVPSLSTVSANSQIGDDIFSNEGYRFFRQVTVDNISNILKLIKEHLDVLTRIYSSGYIDKALYAVMQKAFAGSNVAMYPNYQKISRSDVCFDILNNTDFLGPRNGITTQEHGQPLYLAAATSATTSHVVMLSFINTFKLDDKLKDISGKEIAPNMSLEVQNKLTRMYLSKKLRNSTDVYAYFRNYTITDRDIVVDALQRFHKNNMHMNAKDALTIVVDEISKSIF